MSDESAGKRKCARRTVCLKSIFAGRGSMNERDEAQSDADMSAERLGCGDLLVATAGMGCAILVRILIVGLVVLIMYLVFKFVFHWM